MKLFLTSGGLTTEELRGAFRSMFSANPRVAFVPTAATLYSDTSWLSEDIENVRRSGAEVDLVDISVLSRDGWLSRITAADSICFGGGNTYYLLDWVRRCGLDRELHGLLMTRVYMGISAGSMIAGPGIESNSAIFPEEDEGKIANLKGLSLVPFAIIPHLNSPSFQKSRLEYIQKFAEGVSYPVLALDDKSAVEVNGEEIRVISSGQYRAYNKEIHEIGFPVS